MLCIHCIYNFNSSILSISKWSEKYSHKLFNIPKYVILLLNKLTWTKYSSAPGRWTTWREYRWFSTFPPQPIWGTQRLSIHCSGDSPKVSHKGLWYTTPEAVPLPSALLPSTADFRVLWGYTQLSSLLPLYIQKNHNPMSFKGTWQC